MGRPSLAEPRRAEAISALERCLLRDGWGGTTVQSVAKEAGFHRTLIHHYFGDMDGLVEAAVQSLVLRLSTTFRAAASSSGSADQLLEFLFVHSASSESRLIGALRRADSPAVSTALARMYEGFATEVAELLRREYPNASAKDRRATGIALVSLSMSRYQFESLGVAKPYLGGLRATAGRLVETLEG